MGKANKKQPKAPLVLPQIKSPKSVPTQDFYHLRPAWRVARMELVDPFGWHTIPADKLQEIRNKLGGFEGQTWGDIISKSQNNHHFMPVIKICGDAKSRLSALHMEDTDALFSLRLSGRERIWGILDNGVLIVLWWDPFHSVYPVSRG
ncbi:MAG TPA: hypothetical protein VFK06_10825 [Candidatus Angelobacter sp.]|nr:hypothetical protein [Candidatus Angelobacter sp.]